MTTVCNVVHRSVLLSLGAFSCVLIGWGKSPIAGLGLMLPITAWLFSGKLLSHVTEHLVAMLLLLLLAVAAHSTPMLMNDDIKMSEFVKTLIWSVTAYAGGYMFGRRDREIGDPVGDPVQRVSSVLLWGASGFVGLAIVSVVASGYPLRVAMLPGYATSIVDGEPIHKTHIGMYASMGMCMAPAVLLSFPGRSAPVWQWCFAAFMVIAGAVANAGLQNRTPVIACGAALLIGFTIVGLRIRFRQWRLERWLMVVVGIFLLFVLAILFVVKFYPRLRSTVFYSFSNSALDTPRYMVWREMFNHFFDYFWGGRRIKLAEHFAHDFWLDALYDSGLPAFFLWVAFHACHIRPWLNVVGGHRVGWRSLLVMGMGISLVCSYLVEPVLSASIYYICFGVLFFGYVAGLGTPRSASERARSSAVVTEVLST